MARSIALRSLFLACVGSAAVGSVVFACSDETTSPNASQPEAGAPRQRDSGRQSGETDEDAAGETEDASLGDAAPPKDASPPKDANGPGEAGSTCFFNRDCQLALRCECDVECVCKPGARGTGRNGIDRCDSGDQCASSLCVEGPSGEHYCSDECQGPDDCTGALPRCVAIGGLPEPICVRDPS